MANRPSAAAIQPTRAVARPARAVAIKTAIATGPTNAPTATNGTGKSGMRLAISNPAAASEAQRGTADPRRISARATPIATRFAANVQANDAGSVQPTNAV